MVVVVVVGDGSGMDGCWIVPTGLDGKSSDCSDVTSTRPVVEPGGGSVEIRSSVTVRCFRIGLGFELSTGRWVGDGGGVLRCVT